MQTTSDFLHKTDLNGLRVIARYGLVDRQRRIKTSKNKIPAIIDLATVFYSQPIDCSYIKKIFVPKNNLDPVKTILLQSGAFAFALVNKLEEKEELFID